MIKGHPRNNFLFSLALLGLVSVSPWAIAQQSINDNFATLQGYGNSVFWSIKPGLQYDSIKLTLSSVAGDIVEIESYQEPATDALDDGAYNYELVVTPSLGSSTRAELNAARDAAGGQEASRAVRRLKSKGMMPQQRYIQSGHFMISNGQLVAADAAQE